MSWRTRWRVYEYVRNSIWIVPALFASLAIAMGVVLPDIDESVHSTIGISFGAEAGRSVLGALAGGVLVGGAVLLEPAPGDLSWQLALYPVLSLTLVRMVPTTGFAGSPASNGPPTDRGG
jgi:hypothetical protein